jgi:hypothetical protein
MPPLHGSIPDWMHGYWGGADTRVSPMTVGLPNYTSPYARVQLAHRVSEVILPPRMFKFQSLLRSNEAP